MKNYSFTVLFALFYMSMLSAQIHKQTLGKDEITNKKPKVYILADIDIKGTSGLSKSQILRFAHLNIGDQIIIPGNKINHAIKELWNTHMFNDIDIYASKINKDQLYLEIYLEELPELSEIEVEGIKELQFEKIFKNNPIKTGIRISENLLKNIQADILKYYEEKGYSEVEVKFKTYKNKKNKSNLVIYVKSNDRIKVSKIIFEGNKELSDNILLKSIKNAKKKRFFSSLIFSPSRYISDEFEQDLKHIIEKYQSLGFRDAYIVSHNIWKINKKNYGIKIKLNEGQRYYLGDISFIGNTVFNDKKLKEMLNYKKGDLYDFIGIRKKICDKQYDSSILSAYLDKGYLFSEITITEKIIVKDHNIMDIDVYIKEYNPTTLDKVTFSGNTLTKDNVIIPALLTYPGHLFSKIDVKRTFLNLLQLGLFESEKIIPDIMVNPNTHSTDINWQLTEKGSSQIQFQGGYGNGRLLGTLALAFNNFSFKNIFKRRKWNPIPQGDGQHISLSVQAGYEFQSYSLSFIEPLINIKNLASLNFSINYSKQNIKNKNSELELDSSKVSNSDAEEKIDTESKSETNNFLTTFSTSLSLIKQLNWPDNKFSICSSLNYEQHNKNDIDLNGHSITKIYNDLSHSISIRRISIGPNMIFPTNGSEFNITGILTFPYSFFNKKNTKNNYEWIEYFKFKMLGYWYRDIFKNFIAKIGGEFGFIKNYNSGSISEFQKFFIGGTSLTGVSLGGRDYIPLRGYPNAGDPNPTSPIAVGGGIIYNKFILELRYPVLINDILKIWMLCFSEAGNVGDEYKKYKLFELKRSAGFGVRIFISAIGLIGVDFGYGFDNTTLPSKWQTHFVIGKDF